MITAVPFGLQLKIELPSTPSAMLAVRRLSFLSWSPPRIGQCQRHRCRLRLELKAKPNTNWSPTQMAEENWLGSLPTISGTTVGLTTSGLSLTFSTVTLTVAVAVPPLPSDISYVKLSLPKKLALGVYFTTPLSSDQCRAVGWRRRPSITVNVSPTSGPSLSLASTSMTLSVLSSETVAASLLANGLSLTFSTVTLTVAVAVPPLPSEIS